MRFLAQCVCVGVFVPVVLSGLVGCSDYGLHGTGPGVNVGPDGEAVDDPDGSGEDGDRPGGDAVVAGGVRGRVCAPDGASWVSGATVWVQHTNGVSETVTDGNGWFLVDGIPTGSVVVEITKGSFSVTIPVEVVDGEIAELPAQECLEQGDTRIAVMTGTYDHIQDVLDTVGLEYETVNGQAANPSTAFLRDPALMAQYDVIFFNCGMSDGWLQHEAEVAANVRTFVENGGSVYASDWAYYLVEASFRDQHVFHGNDLQPGAAYAGVSGMVTANVLDPSMQQLLGSNEAVINYDLDSWAAMVTADYAEVLIEGQYTYYSDSGPFTATETRFAPLASRFAYGQGTVIYTSFHNEQQTTFDMDLLLQDIVLSL